MRAEGQAHIDRIEAALQLVRQSLDWERALRRLDELNARVQDPDLWNDPKEAQAISREQKQLETSVNTVKEISSEMGDAIEFIEMGEAEGDDDIVIDGLNSLEKLADRADADKVQALLAGEADTNDTYIEIHAGAGGTESQDWAEMLLRMYLRWGESQGFKTELIEVSDGEVAGIKSATVKFSGEYAYGWFTEDEDAEWMEVVKLNPDDFWRAYFYYNDSERPEEACEHEFNTREHADYHWESNNGDGHYDCTHYDHVVNGGVGETIKHDNQNYYD